MIRVSKAVKEVKASTPEPRTLVDAQPASTDPWFDTCGDANAAGYGNYRQGADVEYGWYQDRDGDGFVCE
ncbi:excalibur calcium-binding domain-containing protein [Aeromicrobium fastidiosum]|uniref:excalibur calcium-binding domain-containing protein n=1 Tax=Aeromicrobium fastidiosum TaxID=52699 RepID=UPI0020234CD2|nr:excalibur calcium-binding domain-containing protein [Aeromicrobium fastidiosum]MCL8250614.1 excalibur calcium-binding domain-containing protein [Aeromicrobium fastidiosum]